LTACKSKYPADRYTIPKSFRDLISAYKVGDTFIFKDDKGNLSHYLTANIDSSFVDEGKGLMKVRGRKDIVVTIRELTNPRKGHEEYHMIILNRYPDKDSATFYLRLKDFYTQDTSKHFDLRTDTIRVNDFTFTNYYYFLAKKYSDQIKPNSVVEIYMTKKDGIVAYKNLNGIWWTKLK
jgi:hypothetical protein